MNKYVFVYKLQINPTTSNQIIFMPSCPTMTWNKLEQQALLGFLASPDGCSQNVIISTLSWLNDIPLPTSISFLNLFIVFIWGCIFFMKYHEFNNKEHNSQHKSLFLLFTKSAKIYFCCQKPRVYKGVTEDTHTPWVF